MAKFVAYSPYGPGLWFVLQINGVIADRVAELRDEQAALRMVDLLNRNGMEDVPLSAEGIE